MAKGINIAIGADSKAALSAIKSGLIEPLEDATKALDKLADKGNDLDSIERGLKADQTATQKWNKELTESVENIRKVQAASSRAAKDVANDFESNARSTKATATANLKELGAEGKQNLAETLSSFDGSVEGFVNGIQGTLGGVIAGLSGVGGILLATAGAAGLGLLVTAIQNGGEAAEEAKQKVSELAAEYIETGDIAKTSLSFIVEKLKALATETDDTKQSLTKLAGVAEKAGSTFEDLALAYAGNIDGLDELIAKNEKLREGYLEEQATLDLATNAGNRRNGELAKSIAGADELLGLLDSTKTSADAAAKAEELYAQAGGPELETKAAQLESINAAYDDAVGSIDDFLNAETGVFDTAAYIASMEAREQALKDYQETLATSGLSPAAKAYLATQGAEAAAIQLDAYVNAGEADKAKLDRFWSEAGRDNSGSYVDEFQGGISSRDNPQMTVDVNGNTTDLDNKLSRSRAINVTINGYTRNGQRVI
jgi:hypothetical protein